MRLVTFTLPAWFPLVLGILLVSSIPCSQRGLPHIQAVAATASCHLGAQMQGEASASLIGARYGDNAFSRARIAAKLTPLIRLSADPCTN